MRRIYLSILMALAASLQLTAYTAQEAVDKFVSNSTLRYASVGVNVIDLDSAKSIASYRPEQANITASTMKTVVSSAALGLMGPHFRFETPVYLDGVVNDGYFKGNIIIRGMGDPTLGSVFMPCQANIVDEILDALRAMGIKHVEGMVIGDDSYYSYPYFDEDWDVGDLAYGGSLPNTVDANDQNDSCLFVQGEWSFRSHALGDQGDQCLPCLASVLELLLLYLFAFYNTIK